jgi:uncharacterized membrane protein
VFEYSTPVIGTHPAWYDPSYWYEGLETHFEPRKQARALRAAAEAYWELLKDAAAPLLAIGVLLSLGPVGDRRRQLSRQWFLFIPAIVPFAMFAVLHTETRFLGAFVVMALLALLLAVQLPPAAHARRVMAVTMIGGTIVLGLRTVVPAAEDLLARGWRLQNPDYDIAVGIRAVGLSPGDRVGAIGYPYDWYWARLAGVRIVADMPSPEVTLFWSATPERRASVYGAFRQAGVRALVSDSVPSTDAARGWSPIGSTGFFVYFLDGGAPR